MCEVPLSCSRQNHRKFHNNLASVMTSKRFRKRTDYYPNHYAVASDSREYHQHKHHGPAQLHHQRHWQIIRLVLDRVCVRCGRREGNLSAHLQERRQVLHLHLHRKNRTNTKGVNWAKNCNLSRYVVEVTRPFVGTNLPAPRRISTARWLLYNCRGILVEWGNEFFLSCPSFVPLFYVESRKYNVGSPRCTQETLSCLSVFGWNCAWPVWKLNGPQRDQRTEMTVVEQEEFKSFCVVF